MTGHNVSIEAGKPSPRCQHSGCHRRAQFMYVSSVTGLRVFRPWCRIHRPGSTVTVETPRPRKYLPEGEKWPKDVRCPHCDRAREPRSSGERRPTCRRHRALAPATAPRPRPVPVARPKPVVRIRKTAPTPPPAPPTFDPFVYREGGRREEIVVPKKDQRWLLELFKTDAGHYSAATYGRLTRRYPTAMISQLWAQWAALQEHTS